uniref:(northern house mosquito) hypothetical protein n=1 Tax=Culex pipiens TaxID=7175 RepID=A0A8D8FXF4_CULPI
MKLRIASTGWKRRRANDPGAFASVVHGRSLECRIRFSTAFVILSTVHQRMNLIEGHWRGILRTPAGSTEDRKTRSVFLNTASVSTVSQRRTDAGVLSFDVFHLDEW